ncbi:MAG: hypothetical protein IH957_01470 [Chloroflexi bacterium]|nr:hypothetical protein [Chloroflexota bacterium]
MATYLVAVLLFTLAASFAVEPATPEHEPASAAAKAPLGAGGTVIGVMFQDIDEDGVRDPGEPGISGHPLELEMGGVVVQTATTAAGGAFSLAAAPGSYTLRADTNFHAFFCVDTFGSFNPTALDDCMTPEVPWAFTTPEEVPLALAAGETETVDFGIRRADVAVLAGIVVHQGGKAPPGTVIEAFVGETKCGETAVESYVPGGIHNYELAVFGAGEIDGCAEPGEGVSFTVNGLQADQVLAYEPTGSGMRPMALVAITDYAIYWAQELALPNAFDPSPSAYGVIDGFVCQGADIQVMYPPFIGGPLVGFAGIAVASAELLPGCGYPGALVSFRVGTKETGTVAVWEPGIHYIDMDLPQAIVSGDVDCSEEVEALDALVALKRIAGLAVTAPCWIAASDVDCNGERNVIDVLVILKSVAALPFVLPEGCPPLGQSGP